MRAWRPFHYSARGLNVGKETGGIGMPRNLVERTFPDGLRRSANDEGAEICRVVVLNNSENDATWIHSYVSGDRHKTFCIYDTASPETIRRTPARNDLPVEPHHEGLTFSIHFSSTNSNYERSNS